MRPRPLGLREGVVIDHPPSSECYASNTVAVGGSALIPAHDPHLMFTNTRSRSPGCARAHHGHPPRQARQHAEPAWSVSGLRGQPPFSTARESRSLRWGSASRPSHRQWNSLASIRCPTPLASGLTLSGRSGQRWVWSTPSTATPRRAQANADNGRQPLTVDCSTMLWAVVSLTLVVPARLPAAQREAQRAREPRDPASSPLERPASTPSSPP